MYAREIISFLTLANMIFESRGKEGENDDGNAIVSSATLEDSSPVILESLSESDKFSISEFKGQSLMELRIDLDHLSSGIQSDNFTAIQSVQNGQNLDSN